MNPIASFALAVAALAIGGYLCHRFLRPYHWKATICLALLVSAGWVVFRATEQYVHGDGGYKLGVDLVGGTILVYEVDTERSSQLNATGEKTAGKDVDMVRMVQFLKRRIDPNDLKNVTIRPIGNQQSPRVELILPTGGSHEAKIKEANWQNLLTAAKEKFGSAISAEDLDVARGKDRDLAVHIQQALDRAAWKKSIDALREKYPALKDLKLDDVGVGQTQSIVELAKAVPSVPPDDIKKFMSDNFKHVDDKPIRDFVGEHWGTGKKKSDFTAEDVEGIKSLIAQQGSLEFRIVANETDDSRAISAAKAWLTDPANKDRLEDLARKGQAPIIPDVREKDDSRTYSWVELGKTERQSLGLSNVMGGVTPRGQAVAAARDKGEAVLIKDNISDERKNRSGSYSMLVYSRRNENVRLTPDEREKKKYDYYMLLRDPLPDDKGKPKAITGGDIKRADVNDENKSVTFGFDPHGAALFYELTSANEPSPRNQNINLTYRHLAIILDGQIMSAPYLSSAIGDQGEIQMGNSARDERVRLATILRAGALPATLKPVPVSESTIGPTLGGDTITKGLWSVGFAFVAVMAFMVFYYRFAGLVACVALLMNLLLTVAFMVLVNAAFTLPGLAGLVLMLGMAVDANVLIYERLREEREKGAGLALAIRNGYDRAFPTIIDTHLTSFFTAIVLYAVGNDQLRGFGISLAVGLVISLYTSLVVTRLIFDLWQSRGWLTKLDMLKFLTKTNIDFMSIRNTMFAVTVALTVLGLGVFLFRGEQSLNIDFVGGTAYGGQLAKATTIKTLRELLHDQDKRLAVTSVEQRDEEGKNFLLVYALDNAKQSVTFAGNVLGPNASKADREAAVKERAKVLPDWSVEQTFVSSEKSDEPGASRFFTVRTTEKEADLVQLSVDRLLSELKNSELVPLQKSTPFDFTINGRTANLTFADFASPGYLKLLLDREFRQRGFGDNAFELRGEGKNVESRFQKMVVEVTAPSLDKDKDAKSLSEILSQTKATFASRPQPERLEKFDAQLAAETRSRALYAIIASWAVILLFLWFRFGNWTFGAAAVLCLIHDLCFTLGAIAGVHYLVATVPGLAHFLLLDDFKIDLPAIAALLTLVGYSVNDTIVVFDRIREVRGKNPLLTPQIINDSINQTLSRTILAATTVFLVVVVLYIFGGEAIRLFAFVMVTGVLVGTYSSIYVASPLLLIFGEGAPRPGKTANLPAVTGTAGS